MNIVIIEDEGLAAKRLEGMIKHFDPSIQVLATLESVSEAVEWFRAHPGPDLIFLDIHLEDGLSFSIFEKVAIQSPIIFTTAFDEYAIKAFKLKSIDYLLKPITQEDLNNAIFKYRNWNLSGGAMIDIGSLYQLITGQAKNFRSRFSVSIGQKIKSIPIEEAAWFYSEESITFLVTRDKLEYPIDLSLDKLEEELDPRYFFRINRQCIVGMKSIGQVHVYPKSRLKIDLQPASAHEVFVSIDKAVKFKTWLNS